MSIPESSKVINVVEGEETEAVDINTEDIIQPATKSDELIIPPKKTYENDSDWDRSDSYDVMRIVADDVAVAFKSEAIGREYGIVNVDVRGDY